MKNLIEQLQNKSNNKYKFYTIPLLISFLIFAGFIGNMFWDQSDNNEKKFLQHLDLQLTLKVLKIDSTGNHGYGVVYGEILKSNKNKSYNAVYDDVDTFCKIQDDKILYISPYYIVKKYDSVILKTNELKYWVYRKKKLVSEYELDFTTDPFLFSDIKSSNYFDFRLYKDAK